MELDTGLLSALETYAVEQLKREIKRLTTWSIENVHVACKFERQETQKWERVSFDLCRADYAVLRFSLRPSVDAVLDLDDGGDQYFDLHHDTLRIEKECTIRERMLNNGIIRTRMYWLKVGKSNSGDFFEVITGAQQRLNAVLPKEAFVLVVTTLRQIVDEYLRHDKALWDERHTQLDNMVRYLGLDDLVRTG